MKTALTLLAAGTILCAGASAAESKAKPAKPPASANLKPNKIARPPVKPTAEAARGLMMKTDASTQLKVSSSNVKSLVPTSINTKAKSVSAPQTRPNKVDSSQKLMMDGFGSAKGKIGRPNVPVAPAQVLQNGPK